MTHGGQLAKQAIKQSFCGEHPAPLEPAIHFFHFRQPRRTLRFEEAVGQFRLLNQGALIPQLLSLLNPFCFSSLRGGRKENGYACEVPLLAGTYMVPKNVYFPPAVYQVPYQALDVLAFS